MSWFEKVIASFGFDEAKVDTLLTQASHCPGAALKATVQINTGNRAIRIDGIKFSVWSQASNSNPVQIAHCTVAEQLQIESNQQQQIPVALALPAYTPLSVGGVTTWLHTELDIPLAPDPQDTDPIEIVADDCQQQIFAALTDLGYQLESSELEALPQQSRYEVPFLQQFHFIANDTAPSQSELQLFWHSSNGESELLVTEIRRLGQQRTHRIDLRTPTQARLVAQLKQLLEPKD